MTYISKRRFFLQSFNRLADRVNLPFSELAQSRALAQTFFFEMNYIRNMISIRKSDLNFNEQSTQHYHHHSHRAMISLTFSFDAIA